MVERVGRIAEVRASTAADAAMVQSGLVAVREARAWLDAQHAGLVAQLQEVSSFPEAAIAEADRTSVGAASKVDGALRDVVGDAEAGRGVGRWCGHRWSCRCGDSHVEATRSGPARRVAGTRRCAGGGGRGGHGRRVPASAWSWRPHGCRPVTVWIASNGNDARHGCRRGWTPTGCGTCAAASTPSPVSSSPPNSTPRSRRCSRNAPRHRPDGSDRETTPPTSLGPWPTSSRVPPVVAGRDAAEYVVVIDADADPAATGWSGRGVADPGRDPRPRARRPRRRRRRRRGGPQRGRAARAGRTRPRSHHPPGQPGPTTRLRGLYRSCAIPGCTVGYDRCDLHHVTWWRHGGRTDLDNLLPICTKHHGKIHHDDWTIELGPNRQLTLRLPDGTIHTT